MGILNVTPDSFFDGGVFCDEASVRQYVELMISCGVDYIDLGAESTRPGSQKVTTEEQINRLRPALDILSDYSCSVTIDTYCSEVAQFCFNYDCVVGINDVSGGRTDSLLKVVASSGRFVILMHSRLTPETMQQEPFYDNVIDEVQVELKKSIDLALSLGMSSHQIWIDPGIGFAKNPEHNMTLLRQISTLKEMGHSVILGVSRKSFMGHFLDCPLSDRLGASLACALYAQDQGVDVIRVHDCRQTQYALKMWSLLKKKPFNIREI